MKEIKVLGSGCAKCLKTAEKIQQVANECDIPAVVIDEQLTHSGSIPNRKMIEDWLNGTL